MLKSNILESLNLKYNKFKQEDIESLVDIFFKKISKSLKEGKNIEIRGFGTISRKENKEKFVRNPKTNERIYKEKTFKIHFKIGKILHQRLNKLSNDQEE